MLQLGTGKGKFEASFNHHLRPVSARPAMETKTRHILPVEFAVAVLALTVSVIQPANAASWGTNGPMANGRQYHTATLLSNGKVLVAGGQNAGYLSSVELYDPASGKWAPTG